MKLQHKSQDAKTEKTEQTYQMTNESTVTSKTSTKVWSKNVLILYQI